MESSTPPRPGIRLPLSLMSHERLKTDSIKSPIIAAIAVIAPRIARFTLLMVITSGKIYLKRKPQPNEPAIPPIKPTRLLLGLAATNPLVDFPKRIPKNQAKESHINTKIKKRLIMYFESGRIVILERKVRSKPV